MEKADITKRIANAMIGNRHPQPLAFARNNGRLRRIGLPPPTTGIRILRWSAGVPLETLQVLPLPALLALLQLLPWPADFARGLVDQPMVFEFPRLPLFEDIRDLQTTYGQIFIPGHDSMFASVCHTRVTIVDLSTLCVKIVGVSQQGTLSATT